MRRAALVLVLLCAAACGRRAPHLAVDRTEAACRSVVPASTPITWISPTDDRDRRRLAAWCDAVGPIVFAPIPARSSAQTADRVVIVSWNTHVGGGDVARLASAVEHGEFTGGDRVDAVVFLLQEAYRHGDGVPDRPSVHAAVAGRIVEDSHATHNHEIRRVAREGGYALFYAPSMRNGMIPDDPDDRGNAILSTLPMSDPKVIELPLERQRRVVPVATIGGVTTNGREWHVRLADVHLDTSLALTTGGPLAARRRQADALIEALDDDRSASNPIVVAGDFNTFTGGDEPALARLRRAFPQASTPGGPTWRGPFGLRGHLDYVFARGLPSLRVRRLDDRFGSDHYPLLAELRF